MFKNRVGFQWNEYQVDPMVELPSSISEYLLHLTIEHRSPAFLVIEPNGRAMWGGNLALYGIGDLSLETPIQEQLLVLEGILPVKDSPVYFPCIEITQGVFADIHVFQKEGKTWVLLLNATKEAERQSLMQQKWNELSLQLNSKAKPGNDTYE